MNRLPAGFDYLSAAPADLFEEARLRLQALADIINKRLEEPGISDTLRAIRLEASVRAEFPLGVLSRMREDWEVGSVTDDYVRESLNRLLTNDDDAVAGMPPQPYS